MSLRLLALRLLVLTAAGAIARRCGFRTYVGEKETRGSAIRGTTVAGRPGAPTIDGAPIVRMPHVSNTTTNRLRINAAPSFALRIGPTPDSMVSAIVIPHLEFARI